MIKPARWAESSANVASWTRTSAPRPIGSTLLLSQVSPRITSRLRSTAGGGQHWALGSGQERCRMKGKGIPLHSIGTAGAGDCGAGPTDIPTHWRDRSKQFSSHAEETSLAVAKSSVPSRNDSTSVPSAIVMELCVMGTMVITQALLSRTRRAIAAAVSLLHQFLPSRRAHRPRWVGPTTSSGRTTRPSGVSTGCPAFSRPYSGPFGTPNGTPAPPRGATVGFLREL